MARSAGASSPQTRIVNPQKLLLSKWTAVAPQDKEKHFMVIGLIKSDSQAATIETIELEAVYSRRSVVLPWRELCDDRQWLQGWK